MKRSKLWLAAVLLCLVVIAAILARPIFRGIGSLYVQDGPPVKADIIVVLAGDPSGHRILKGAELARQGFAPLVLSDSSELTYGHTDSELAAEYAIGKGYSPDLFITVNWSATSTVEEAGRVVADLRRRGVHRVLIVTTLWHTARAGRIFRRLSPEIEFRMVGIGDPTWHGGDWWKEREGRKTFLLEGVKTIADYLGI
jgi:uncharacterized SAM-binding protein YcdF (DUF218 family)